MGSRIINISQLRAQAGAGFTNAQFKKLAGLFSQAASVKALYDIAVDVDMDEGVSTLTYYRSREYVPYVQFVIRRVGPRTNMYEVYKQDKGRIVKSGIFQRAFDVLEEEILDRFLPPS